MTERRYSEEEVSTIFERAAEAQQAVRRQLPAGGEGMTLAELRTIGNEVGIPAELVDQAALSVDQTGRDASRTFLGLPIGVGRTVQLSRRLTDDEWERLVVDLRETFDARGRVQIDGSLKTWNNGNLQALLEPTATGSRVRLKTLMSGAQASMTLGIGLVGVSAAVVVGAAVSGHIAQALAATGSMWIIGAGLFTMGAARLPRWSKLRRKQMEGVAARLALATESPKELTAGE
ncbi:MAG TPA: hypothetical protein VGI92_04520 [Gemmatimonadales bacterium]|jgi:hypothetical protein